MDGSGGGGHDKLFLVTNVFHRGCTNLPREAIGPLRGPIASRRWSVPVFLRKYIANCVLPGGGMVQPCRMKQISFEIYPIKMQSKVAFRMPCNDKIQSTEQW